ncbi:MAG: beta-lactamase superfamily II [Verrucomicrobia bacterium]|nr:MAG: beta-lactamase superfamily II [Verrucomicrobiota bacterium]
MQKSFSAPPHPLFYAALSAVAGVLFFDRLPLSFETALGLFSGAAMYAVFRPIRNAALTVVFLGAGGLHLCRHHLCPSRESVSRLAQNQVESVELQGEVEDVPQASANPSKKTVPQSTFHLLVRTSSPAEAVLPGSRLLVHWRGAPPGCGDQVWLRAALQRIPPPRNPGERDYAAFHSRQDVWAEVFLRHPSEGGVASTGGWRLQTWAAQTREVLSAQLLRGIEERPQIHELITSMVFGIQGHALQEERPWFRDSGTLHLFAVSGLNLSMLAGFLAFLLRLAGAGPRVAAVVALPLLVGYAVVTGLGTSCVRALCMSVLWLGVAWINRPVVGLNSLGAAALLLLLVDGNFLFEVGFQLSFGLVLALNLFCHPLTKTFRKALEPDALLPPKLWSLWQRRWIFWGGKGAEAISTAAVCWIAGLPWGLFVFHQIAPVSILANLVAVPLAFLNLALGFLGLLCAPLGPVTPALNRSNAACAKVLLDCVAWSSSLPGGHWPVGSPWRRTPSLVVFDAGEGGAILLGERGCHWLLDCGSTAHASQVLLPALALYGICKIDGLVLSHGDSAHVGGALPVFEKMSPPLVVKTAGKDRSPQVQKIEQGLLEAGAVLRRAHAGMALETPAPVICEILYPPPGLVPPVADDHCLIVRWSTPQWTILYTADSGFPSERWLLEHHPEKLRVDLWIRGSHGRETTGTDDFVRAVNPRLAIVAGSRFQQNQGALEAWALKWRRQGMAVWLQKECGAVEAWPGTTNRLRSFLSGQEFSWCAAPVP